MIIFVLSAEHRYTHETLVGRRSGATVDLLTYPQLFQLRQLPRATYIFTDHDRLPTEMLRAAASIYQQLRLQGIVALNDPARVLSRYGLLRALFQRGLNQFNAYRAEEGVTPERWPVFLRADGDHMGPLPELYRRARELQAGIRQAVDRGIPMSRLLVIEYAAQPTRPGLFTKHSSFRMGKSEFACTNVHDNQWIAKTGKRGIATPELYLEELRIVRENPHAPAVAAAFEAAGIDYGRADFGMVDGKVQIYEINTNPNIALRDDHPSEVRQQSYRAFEENYFGALRANDTPDEARR